MENKKKKYYAVARGRKPGIYTVWFGPSGAHVQVDGYQGARFKGFPSYAEAEAWIKEQSSVTKFPSVSTNKRSSAQHEELDDADIKIFTDGGAINNPGPGGYGIVIIENGARREFSGGYRNTTNNRMELMGAIVALSQFPSPEKIVLRTDSRYVVNGIEQGWAKKWRKNGWMRTKSEAALNYDLWERLLELTEFHEVRFRWVKGHAGHEENERCDQLVRSVSARRDLPPDVNYESGKTTIK